MLRSYSSGCGVPTSLSARESMRLRLARALGIKTRPMGVRCRSTCCAGLPTRCILMVPTSTVYAAPRNETSNCDATWCSCHYYKQHSITDERHARRAATHLLVNAFNGRVVIKQGVRAGACLPVPERTCGHRNTFNRPT
jgi:hypothetical protein